MPIVILRNHPKYSYIILLELYGRQVKMEADPRSIVGCALHTLQLNEQAIAVVNKVRYALCPMP
ncbi:MAG: hypothetical protein WBL95_08190 [Microcoleus sp.]